MKIKPQFTFLLIIGLAVIIVGLYLYTKLPASPDSTTTSDTKKYTNLLPLAKNSPTPTPIVISFVGPRENIPSDAPIGYGFWSFAMPADGILSRSGQPLIEHFQWLKENGWQSVIDLRRDGERNEVGDDAKIPGFNELDFNYLHLPITDGHPPTNEQAEEFLAFVTDPANQPVHIHCRGGIGRAGTMTVLYRYAVDGWPLADAIAESRPFRGGISGLQENWLEEWAVGHETGSHAI
jgi:protein-tyrosine phosphatase